MVQPRWDIQQLTGEHESVRDRLAGQLHISKVSASLLVQRGLTTPEAARAFIAPRLEALHDPFLMRDMDKAVSRLRRAVENGERILVYGDYDVDGTTAVALVFSFLSRLPEYADGRAAALLDYYIPDRYQEGYGISFRGVDYAAETGSTLIIALDCGIRSVDKVDYARSKGIDFIICDHHLPGADIPSAVAVLDAKRADSTYPYAELCGCGVGFKLVHAYIQQCGLPSSLLEPLLEPVAMAIASDIVPVTGENRILAYYGLKRINRAPSVGLESLLRVAGIEQGKVGIGDLVYKIGPRINACGRLKSGRDAVRLLVTTDPEEAQQMSSSINENNQARKDLDHDITEAAVAQLKADPHNEERKTTVVCGKDWHKGVVGIVASRLTEQWYRPTIVLTETDGIASGSARSVGGFDIYSAIDSCSDLLTNFGGHVFAAGLSMKSENVPLFKERFEAYVAAHILPEQLQPVIRVEAEICFADITAQFFNILRHLEPFGPGNPCPVFVTRNVCNYRYTKRVGKQGEHLRLDVTDRTGALSGIAFGRGNLAIDLMNGRNADLCYELHPNTFNGNTTIQMMVQDIVMLPESSTTCTPTAP